MTTTPRSRLLRRALPAALACLAAWCVLSAPAQELPAKLKQSEAERVAVIEKVRPSVVAVFSAGGAGGGSGVLIDE